MSVRFLIHAAVFIFLLTPFNLFAERAPLVVDTKPISLDLPPDSIPVDKCQEIYQKAFDIWAAAGVHCAACAELSQQCAMYGDQFTCDAARNCHNQVLFDHTHPIRDLWDEFVSLGCRPLILPDFEFSLGNVPIYHACDPLVPTGGFVR